MKETVLLYNFTDSRRLMKVKQALLPMGFRLKPVDKEDYHRPIGALAGVKGLEKNEVETEPREKQDFDDEMIVMAGFTSIQVDALIKALRRNGVGRIDYKAVLTQHNKDWDSVKLYREIKREHEEMSKRTAERAGE